MTQKTLTIIESAYRATIEEQDDTVIWMMTAMKGAGADVHILLRGNAVNYAVKGQKTGALSFGDWKQNHPADIEGDVKKMIDKGLDVFVVEEDVAELGLERNELIDNVKSVNRAGLAKMIDGFERILHF